MILKSINICMEQKKIFIANLLQYTQQMDEACQNDDIDSLSGLFQNREDYMHRIDKCDALIKKLIDDLPETQQVMLSNIFTDPSGDYRCTDDILSIQTSQKEYNVILKEVITINKRVFESLKNSHAEILIIINNERPRNISQQKRF